MAAHSRRCGAVLGQPFRAPWRQALWQDVQHCSAVSASSGVTRALVANRHAWLVGFGCTRRLIRSPPAAAVEKSSMAGSSDPAQPKARCRERVHVHVAVFNDRMHVLAHACMHACAAATSLTLRARYTVLPGARACSRCGDGPKERSTQAPRALSGAMVTPFGLHVTVHASPALPVLCLLCGCCASRACVLLLVQSLVLVARMAFPAVWLDEEAAAHAESQAGILWAVLPTRLYACGPRRLSMQMTGVGGFALSTAGTTRLHNG